MRLTAAWKTWLAENLAAGCSPRGLARILANAGLTPAMARREISAALAHPAVRAALRLASRRASLEGVLEVYEQLHRQSGKRSHIERRAGLAPEEFFASYYFRNRPVVLEGLMADESTLAHWSPESLAERMGDERVEVMSGRDADPAHERRPDEHRTRIRLREFIHQLRDGGSTNDIYLTARNGLLRRKAFRPLLETLRVPAGLITPAVTSPNAAQLWLGPAGTFSQLHHDQINVLFCQLHGRKRFWMIPSFEIGRAYNRSWLQSEVEIRAPDTRRFPAFAEASVCEVELGPGDALFIPVGWWHAVLALEVSLSIGFVSFAAPRQNTLWRRYRVEPILAEL